MNVNLVLLPKLQSVSESIIDLANNLSFGLEPNYLLKNSFKLSIPHLSVLQFSLEQNKNTNLSQIWENAMSIWQELLEKKYQCHLCSKIQYKYDIEGPFAGTSWAEISVDKLKSPWLQLFHDKLIIKLEPFLLNYLNKHKEYWVPHLTLFNTTKNLLPMKSTLIHEIPKDYMKELEYVSLRPALGYANEQWELTALEYLL